MSERKKVVIMPIPWKQCDCGCLGDTFELLGVWRRVHTEDEKVVAVDLRYDWGEHGKDGLIKRVMSERLADDEVRGMLTTLVKKIKEYLP